MAATRVTSCSSSWPDAAPSRDWHGRSTSRLRVDTAVIVACWATLAAVTAVAAGVALVWPALGPGARPHPALRPSAGAVVSILVNNLRVLAAPFVLVVARFARARAGRLAGDLLICAILVINATSVGLALGRWGVRLIPFIPQLPVEYLATATAATAWLGARHARPESGLPRVTILALATAALTAIAAVLEVLLTPHVR